MNELVKRDDVLAILQREVDGAEQTLALDGLTHDARISADGWHNAAQGIAIAVRKMTPELLSEQDARTIATLRARVAELEGALRPFAKLAEEIFARPNVLGEYIKFSWVRVTWNGEHDIKPAALYRAAALAGAKIAIESDGASVADSK